MIFLRNDNLKFLIAIFSFTDKVVSRRETNFSTLYQYMYHKIYTLFN